MKNVLVQALTLLSAVTILACQARKGPEVEGGGMDGGGGTIVFHSREKVIEIVNQVWAQFAINRLDNPFLVALKDVYHKEDIESLHTLGMLQKITGLQDHFISTLHDKSELEDELPFMRSLAGKKLTLLESGYCDSPEHKRASASVSKWIRRVKYVSVFRRSCNRQRRDCAPISSPSWRTKLAIFTGTAKRTAKDSNATSWIACP